MPSTRSRTAHDRNLIAQSNEPAQTALAHEQASNPRHGLRQRPTPSPQYLTNDPSYTPQPRDTPPETPPRFTINLSLPPEQRYVEVGRALKSEALGLTSLFDEVVGEMVPWASTTWLHRLARLLLRGVYHDEETAELRGLSGVTGVPLYLFVCFNVLLDLFMGCSSGGAAVSDGTGGSKMVHFRALDWGMPALRRIVVHLDFVMEEGGEVVASSITYLGFVGVLTGVREGFSVSLNFRPHRNDSDLFWANAKYGWHLLMVLLGRRQSISSTLRHYLLPKPTGRAATSVSSARARSTKASAQPNEPPLFTSYDDVVGQLKQEKVFTSTACYLCFSSGAETTVVEKDRITAKVRSSDDFIVITNNDEEQPALNLDTISPRQHREIRPKDAALSEIVTEANDRKECAEHNYRNMRVAAAKRAGLANPSPEELKKLLTTRDVVEMVQKYPTTNETTHYACVMDPKEGKVVWCRKWGKPVGARWIREHRSGTW